MIDMEDHSYVDRTLDVFRAAHARAPSTGLAIQSYLRRTPDDLFSLPAGCRIRLVKGAYLEPSSIVVGGKREVDRAFTRLFVTALDRGHRIDVATHDEHIRAAYGNALTATRTRVERVEFQMLYGVRRDLQAQLAGQGYPVRVYIPYGTEWYPYLTRRLAERPANLWFFATQPGEDVMTERTVAFLGGGKMGEALISGLIRSGGRTADEIMVTCRRDERARELGGKYGIAATLDNGEAARWARTLVLDGEAAGHRGDAGRDPRARDADDLRDQLRGRHPNVVRREAPAGGRAGRPCDVQRPGDGRRGHVGGGRGARGDRRAPRHGRGAARLRWQGAPTEGVAPGRGDRDERQRARRTSSCLPRR